MTRRPARPGTRPAGTPVRTGTRGPSARGAFALLLALLTGCGAGTDGHPPDAGRTDAAVAAARDLMEAVDTADTVRFAARCADRGDAEARPVAADDVRATVQRLHEAYGQRPRSLTVGAALGREAGFATDVDVDVDGGAATLTFTLRPGKDGTWRVVAFAEAVAPASPSAGAPAGAPPGGGPAPGK